MRVIGTAGHVDHGKTTLIEALTGINPDRLKEERERQMTIDLGFAWLDLPNGEQIGIVDVPGHRDFIENMLAGITSIDAALFVIAADEGVMPQTREHLAILDLLEIKGGVIALTKVDLVDDPGWLDLVELDIRQVIQGTVLENAPIVPVSARSGEGLTELKEALMVNLTENPPRPDLGRPRLPVDRVFSVAGFGTVITGTLSDGNLRVGDEVEILPNHLKGKIRGLQTHKRKEDIAVPGSRTAVNISGINLSQIKRGNVVSHPGDYTPSRRLDVQFRHLKDVSRPLLHNSEVKLFIGSAEVLARLRLLLSDELTPGESGWLQLELKEPVVAMRGDKYILRRPSPGETIGGGIVLDPFPKSRHKRFAPGLQQQFEALAKGNPQEILEHSLVMLGIVPLQASVRKSELDTLTADQVIQQMISSGEMLVLEDKAASLTTNSDVLVVLKSHWNIISQQVVDEVTRYHRAFPLKLGLSREELKSRLAMKPRVFNAVLKQLTQEGELEEKGPIVLKPGHAIQLSPQQQKQIEQLLSKFRASPYAPPSVKDSINEIGEDLYNAMLDLGLLFQVSDEVVFRKEDYENMLEELRNLFEKNGTLTAAQVRDHFNTSRRYTLALLEYLDRLNITVREGESRRMRVNR
jgi:selenocysteine-specific elongation factor